jgi:hypothetical protein
LGKSSVQHDAQIALAISPSLSFTGCDPFAKISPKSMKLLAKKGAEVGRMTLTNDYERQLLSNDDYSYNEYFSKSFELLPFDQLIEKAKFQPTDKLQVKNISMIWEKMDTGVVTIKTLETLTLWVKFARAATEQTNRTALVAMEEK